MYFLHIILKQKGGFSLNKEPKIDNDWIDIFCILDETQCLRVL